MTKVEYDWINGAPLLDHTARKLKILKEYLADYLKIRCQNPNQRLFRLAFVDGFSGGGRYRDGEPGSPVVFLAEIIRSVEELNLRRAAEGFALLDIECLIIVNDIEEGVMQMLRREIAPTLEIARTTPHLAVRFETMTLAFEEAYPQMKRMLQDKNINNVLFNLDQCGHSMVDSATLKDIMSSFGNPEIFYTVAIKAFLAFLEKNNPGRLASQTSHFGTSVESIGQSMMTDKKWLGQVEKLVFSALRDCAPHLSPFSIHNPEGWQYWLVHFVKSHKGREAYNNVLHRNSSLQAHYGRSGLNMLAYKSEEEQSLFLFDQSGRDRSLKELHVDIPNLIAENGDALQINDFLEQVYSQTPAHGDDVRKVLIENTDIEVLTPNGGARQKAHQIRLDDIVRLKAQHSFWHLF